MGRGSFWSKIKTGFSKVWGGIKKGATWVKDKVLVPAWKGIKTIAKPVSKLLVKAAPAITGAATTALGAPELAPAVAGGTKLLTSALGA